MRRAFLLVASLAGCNTTNPPPDAAAGCTVYFAGDITDMATAPSCTTYGVTDAGALALVFLVSSPKVPELAVEIDFPSPPTVGALSSDTVASWAVNEDLGADACNLSAGSLDVPTGSFTLNLTAVDAGPTGLHGVLDLVLYVHSPALTDCGPHDIEDVEVRF